MCDTRTVGAGEAVRVRTDNQAYYILLSCGNSDRRVLDSFFQVRNRVCVGFCHCAVGVGKQSVSKGQRSQV